MSYAEKLYQRLDTETIVKRLESFYNKKYLFLPEKNVTTTSRNKIKTIENVSNYVESDELCNSFSKRISKHDSCLAYELILKNTPVILVSAELVSLKTNKEFTVECQTNINLPVALSCTYIIKKLDSENFTVNGTIFGELKYNIDNFSLEKLNNDIKNDDRFNILFEYVNVDIKELVSALCYNYGTDLINNSIKTTLRKRIKEFEL